MLPETPVTKLAVSLQYMPTMLYMLPAAEKPHAYTALQCPLVQGRTSSTSKTAQGPDKVPMYTVLW